jgi:23S rRNA (pseudouridine1915-N3)-methyltransferase
MKIRLLVIGKTEERYLVTGISEYLARIKRYVPLEYLELPSLKHSSSLSTEEQLGKEKELFLRHLQAGEYLVLLDEHGQQKSSRELARFLDQRMLSGIKSLVFIVGGPYGFHPGLKKQANEIISLSRLTFSHQMARLIVTEQVYRAFTILRNEPYHHD